MIPRRKKPQPRDRALKGAELWRALGFTNERAFQRARERGINLPMYPMPGSKGVWARSSDVTAYLERVAAATPSTHEPD